MQGWANQPGPCKIIPESSVSWVSVWGCPLDSEAPLALTSPKNSLIITNTTCTKKNEVIATVNIHILRTPKIKQKWSYFSLPPARFCCWLTLDRWRSSKLVRVTTPHNSRGCCSHYLQCCMAPWPCHIGSLANGYGKDGKDRKGN